MRRLLALVVVLSGLAVAPAATAAIPDVFNGDVTCSVAGDGHRVCGSNAPRSTTRTFDGVPIDVNVAFPPEPVSGPDGSFPLMMMFHGYSGSKFEHAAMDRWLDQGYAVFTMTTRGMGQSCGVAAAVAADPVGCGGDNAYIHLMDTRMEVRDAQTFAGKLVDEGLVDPQKIGTWGGSYGGGMSMSLAALRDRVMKADGSLMPWTSPLGTPLGIAGAAPEVPWTDLAYSLAPNGGTLDYVTDAPYRGRIGVEKESYVLGLYLSRQSTGRYAPPGQIPAADLTGWKNLLEAGEPYDTDPAARAMITELTTYHSSYYIDNSVPPAPMLISSGWTDDLFPVDEALRYYNQTRTKYRNAAIGLQFYDAGHARGQNKPADNAAQIARENRWLAYYVKGEGERPWAGIETMTQTCPNTAPSEGPYRAKTWASLPKGEVRLRANLPRTIKSWAGYPAVGNPFEPNFGGGACATAPGADKTGTASYRVAKPTGDGFTLMGSPTVIADFTTPGANSQVAARLLDVDPGGQATLVARGLWRPEIGAKPVRQVFQLHPNGYRFAAGHVAKLELLPHDAKYGRQSNGQEDVDVANLELRLPVLEKPGALRGLVGPVSKPVVPAGMKLTADVRRLPVARVRIAGGKLKVRGNRLRVKVTCPARVAVCSRGRVKVTGKPKKGRSGRGPVARGSFSLKGGKSKTLGLKLSRKARKHFRKKRSLPVKVTASSSTTPARTTARRTARK